MTKQSLSRVTRRIELGTCNSVGRALELIGLNSCSSCSDTFSLVVMCILDVHISVVLA